MNIRRIITDKFGVYYAEAIDTDSHTPAWVKVWDPREIPAYVISACLTDYLTPDERARVMSFDHKMEFKRSV